jgi:hypothetical protein
VSDIRRYQFFPGTEVITALEGVVIVDLPPPGSIQGVSTGKTALIGEFADMTYAVLANSSGEIATKHQPVQVFTTQDMLNKVGSFDPTLGEFGGDCGNGFVELRSKKFSALVLVPVNLCSDRGTRVWRTLPTCRTATDPNPVVPMQAATVVAGREFRSGANRIRLGARHSFSGDVDYARGIVASVTAAGAAVTQTALLVGVDYVSLISVGDAFVLGVIGGVGALGANADTYRITAVTLVGADTQITVQKRDGSSFDWTTGAALPFRLHLQRTYDSGAAGNILSAVAGYRLPARPLDATIAAATTVSPTVVPAAATATTWDPLSDLKFRTHPTGALTYTAAIQAPNAVNSASLDALYQDAIDSLLGDSLPQRDVSILWAARKSSTIRTKLRTHVLTQSENGVGRMACISPELTTLSNTAVQADTDPGVGGNRDERVIYDWPGLRVSVPEAVGFNLAGADGSTVTDGTLDTTSDGWLASIMSNLPPERNPAQGAPPVPSVMAPVLGFQRGVTPPDQGVYTAFRQRGICAPKIDPTIGPMFQSGITTSLIAGQKNINRRRMADFIEDSIAQRLVQFSKLPLTLQLRDGIVAECDAFLSGLLAANNPAAQRISDYQVDPVSGNTPTLEAQGIFVVIIRVRTLATADFIVLQAEVGEGVNILPLAA